MRISLRNTFAAILLILAVGFLVGKGEHRLFAQNTAKENGASSEPEKAAPKEAQLDEYQRSGQLLYMQRMGKDGADRGQEIYYMKCWMCHNDYTRKVDPKAAPTLKGLYTRAKLMSGDPVNEETVRKQIKEGSQGMPSYKAVLSDKDLADLLAYLKEKCCWDEMNPAANPRYRAQ